MKCEMCNGSRICSLKSPIETVAMSLAITFELVSEHLAVRIVFNASAADSKNKRNAHLFSNSKKICIFAPSNQ